MTINDFGVYTAWYLTILLATAAIYYFGGHFAMKKAFNKHRQTTIETLENRDYNNPDTIYILNRTLKENIMYGNLQAADEDYRLVLDTVMLAGEYTYYSKSDKERVALARDLISKPAEITVALPACDSLTRRQIAENIERNYPETAIKFAKST
jgi:hypothetical protein